VRKAKEEEKFRTEKENWILNVLKTIKDFTLDQKSYIKPIYSSEYYMKEAVIS
jgi:hypothetical protein